MARLLYLQIERLYVFRQEISWGGEGASNDLRFKLLGYRVGLEGLGRREAFLGGGLRRWRRSLLLTVGQGASVLLGEPIDVLALDRRAAGLRGTRRRRGHPRRRRRGRRIALQGLGDRSQVLPAARPVMMRLGMDGGSGMVGSMVTADRNGRHLDRKFALEARIWSLLVRRGKADGRNCEGWWGKRLPCPRTEAERGLRRGHVVGGGGGHHARKMCLGTEA